MIRNYFIFIVFFSVHLAGSSSLNAEKISLQGIIQNGTTGNLGTAESAKLIILQDGMREVANLQSLQGKFSFQGVDVPNQAPLLVQLTYSGVNYNKLIPPTPEFRQKESEITVYDVSDDPDILDTKSILHIVRDRDFLIINKYFLINNVSKPPKSFVKQDFLEIYIPKNAEDLYAQLVQSDSKMGIPLKLKNGKLGKLIERPILPGLSEIQVSYTIKAQNSSDADFEDMMIVMKKDDYRVIFYKPKDMKVQITNSIQLLELKEDLPVETGAFKVIYPEKNTIKIHVSGGSPIKRESENNSNPVERKIINGDWFYTWDRTLLGVIGVICLFFIFSFIFVYRD
ncbi:MAG: hypothetical protein H7A23_01670 [Leptospiraceae bacterium]|nr:hypothetical protein [Leptospiraceae bacterium]